MCATCGCSATSSPQIIDVQNGVTVPLSTTSNNHGSDHHHHHEHDHHHHHHGDGDHDHHHHHEHAGNSGTILTLEQEILAKNNQLAERNRGWFAGRNSLALNLMSSPGSGKTTLLEKTIRAMSEELSFHVIEGDQETVNDAERIGATGCRVVQVNTGTGCHLDAVMVAQGLKQLNPPLDSVILIENVGNLVCPALFDLGEHARIVIVSVTEGEDKPVKYPHAFRGSDVLILNKIDLLPYLEFDVERFLEYARQVNPDLTVLQTSATRGDGLEEWYQWLREFRQQQKQQGVLS